jgi:hypothetical protein
VPFLSFFPFSLLQAEGQGMGNLGPEKNLQDNGSGSGNTDG